MQQGLERAFGLFEKELGITLLNQAGSECRPTDSRAEFATRPQAAIISYDELKQLEAGLSAQSSKPIPTQIDLYLSPLAAAIIEPTMAAMGKRFPEARIIERYHYSMLMTCADTHNETARFSLISVAQGSELAYALDEQDGLVFKPLLEFSVLAKVRKQSSLADRRLITRSDLRRHPLAFMNGPAFEELLEDIIDEESMDGMASGLWPSSGSAAGGSTRQGSAIGFTTSLCRRFSAKEYVTVPLETHPKISIGSVRNIDVPPRPCEIAMERFFAEQVPRIKSLPF